MALLVSLSDMKDYLGIVDNTYDTFLTNQITIISDSIEGYCGRIFSSASYIQTFYGADFEKDLDSQYLYTFHYPVTAVSEVKEVQKNSDGTTRETIIPSDEYLFNGKVGKFYRTFDTGLRRFWFSDYGSNSQVVISYTAGYASTPTPIQDVVFNLVEQRYNRKVAGIDLGFGNDVQRVSIPGVMSIDFDYTLQQNERSSAFGMILGNHINILDHYRSERSLVGSIKENYV
jgi:hypothetical protein